VRWLSTGYPDRAVNLVLATPNAPYAGTNHPAATDPVSKSKNCLTFICALTQIDLSKIDFDALKSKFKKSGQKQTEIEVLKAAVKAQLDKPARSFDAGLKPGERVAPRIGSLPGLCSWSCMFYFHHARVTLSSLPATNGRPSCGVAGRVRVSVV